MLPDIVGADPVIVFCGLAGAESTKTRDHYYASPGNNFWECLHLSGLSPRRLAPTRTARWWLGLGLTDLVGHWDHETGRGWVEIDLLVARSSAGSRRSWRSPPRARRACAAKALGQRAPGLGLASWGIGQSEVFVLPGTSGANQRKDYDGRPQRLAWWSDLAALAAPELGGRRSPADLV